MIGRLPQAMYLLFQSVDDSHLVAGLEQKIYDMGADEPRSASD
jgi:hypothetical protein